MTATKFRKKPVEIEAVQLTRTNVDEVAAWCGGQVVRMAKPSDPSDVYVALDIPTLEGKMRADSFHSSTYSGGEYHGGDYIIRGVQGEFYPCKPDIFAATYERADAAQVVYADGGEVRIGTDGLPVLEQR